MRAKAGILRKQYRERSHQVEFRLQIRPGLDAFFDMGITIDNVHKNFPFAGQNKVELCRSDLTFKTIEELFPGGEPQHYANSEIICEVFG
jgi:hypothetical protein